MVGDITMQNDEPALSRLGPILVFAIVFLMVMGGIAAYAMVICHGHVASMSLDFWKGVGKIQCR